jgi:kynurenine formamidase
MIDLSKYRVIDLSYELLPGERKIDGRYLHGEPFVGRPIQVHEFIAFSARMHFIQSETHNGTHVESAYKYSEDGTDIGSMPVESYMGEAVVCDFAHKSEGEAVTSDNLREAGVRGGDIALIRGGDQREAPYLTFEAVDWLIEVGIKAIGMEGVLHSPAGTPYGKEDGDGRRRHLDALTGLHKIKKQRVFFIGLPVKIRRVSASWTRAIALEEL